MKKHLLTLALAALASPLAFSQSVLFIESPASIAGTYDLGNTSLFGKPANDWGIGDIDTVPIRFRGETLCVMAPLDTEGCAAYAPGYFNNKIAIIWRGTCEFGVKAKNAQDAGAKGFIIVNNDRPIGGLAAGSVGADVTIPGFLVDKNFFNNTLRATFCAGTGVSVGIGSLQGLFPNNVSLGKSQVIAAPSSARPDFLISDTGDFVFTPGGNVVNLGQQAAASTEFRATITRTYNGSTTTIYDHALTVANLAAGDTNGGFVGPRFYLTDIPAPRVGEYVLTYSATAANDQFPGDNVFTQTFYITSQEADATPGIDKLGIYAKSRLAVAAVNDPTPYTPQYTNAYSPSGGGAFQYGLSLRTHTVPANVTANGIKFAYAGDSLPGQSVTINMHEWTDQNADGAIQDAEVSGALGTGTYDFVAGDQYKYQTVSLFDLNTANPGVPIQSNKTYFFLASYSGSVTVYIASDEAYDYTLYQANNDDLLTPLFSDQWYAGGFGANIQPSMGVEFGLNTNTALFPVGVRTSRKPAFAMTVAPVPTSDVMNITMGKTSGRTLISISDLSGRVVSTSEHTVSEGQAVKLSVGTLSNGAYNLSVRTAQGVVTNRIVVNR